MLEQIEVFCTDDNLLPTRAHSTDAGLDLKASKQYILTLNRRIMVNTGVRVKIPKGYVGLLYARSSLSKRGIVLLNGVGVIDSDYRGEIMAPIMFIDIDPEGISYGLIEQYERIVQLVIQPIELVNIKKFNGTEEDWVDTVRGAGGFGSTGK